LHPKWLIHLRKITPLRKEKKMSTMPLVPSDRHPLGLPPGSIRAILSLGIAGAFWLYLTHPQATHVPLYLHFLSFSLLLFFASHGRTIGQPGSRSPWHLPRGTFRFLIIGGSIAVIVWQFMNDPGEMAKRLQPTEKELQSWSLLSGAMIGGFFFGWLLSHGPWRNSPAYQDLMAWIAVVALLMMMGETLWKVFIDPKAELLAERPIWETILVAVISFYYGTRS
jgi:hypothetical protein